MLNRKKYSHFKYSSNAEINLDEKRLTVVSFTIARNNIDADNSTSSEAFVNFESIGAMIHLALNALNGPST